MSYNLFDYNSQIEWFSESGGCTSMEFSWISRRRRSSFVCFSIQNFFYQAYRWHQWWIRMEIYRPIVVKTLDRCTNYIIVLTYMMEGLLCNLWHRKYIIFFLVWTFLFDLNMMSWVHVGSLRVHNNFYCRWSQWMNQCSSSEFSLEFSIRNYYTSSLEAIKLHNNGQSTGKNSTMDAWSLNIIDFECQLKFSS